MPVLSRALLESDTWKAPDHLVIPSPTVFELPERAVQFGTGAFLRGFVEYFVDVANAQGHFNGRVVIVGSTGSGRDAAFGAQDGLYTLQTAGADDSGEVRVVASVSRALNAVAQWDAVLAVARQPEIAVVFSNTTEAGFALSADDHSPDGVPVSYPAKLTRFLLERARHFNFDASAGVVVLPCELLEDNGDQLRKLVRETAQRWQVDERFFRWLYAAVPFCNTLVDRIVPGAPTDVERARLSKALGYTDQLMTMAEPYRLFAIEADAATQARLTFASADPAIVMTTDIRPYRERKVRLLNGTHTALAAIGLLRGLDTVDAAMRDALVAAYARQLALEEIAPMLDVPDAAAFGTAVLWRFSNPHVHHRLADISVQGTLKLRVRILPMLSRYVTAGKPVPPAIVLAIAAQWTLAHPSIADAWRETGRALSSDDLRGAVRAHWEAAIAAGGDVVTTAIARIVADHALWQCDLSQCIGLEAQLVQVTAQLLRDGITVALTTCVEHTGLERAHDFAMGVA